VFCAVQSETVGRCVFCLECSVRLLGTFCFVCSAKCVSSLANVLLEVRTETVGRHWCCVHCGVRL